MFDGSFCFHAPFWLDLVSLAFIKLCHFRWEGPISCCVLLPKLWIAVIWILQKLFWCYSFIHIEDVSQVAFCSDSLWSLTTWKLRSFMSIVGVVSEK